MAASAWARRGALLMTCALVGAGCGGQADRTQPLPGDGTGTIQVVAHQGQANEVAALQAAVKDFNARQKDVHVDLKLIPEADYTKTLTTTNPKKLADVVEFDGPQMSWLAYSGKLSPLAGLVSPATIANQTASVKAQDSYPGDGKLYGVAQFDSALGLYGNKKLLDAAGVRYPRTIDGAWTADQFDAALKALAAKDPDHLVLDLKENYAGTWPMYAFLPIINSTGNVVLKDNRAEGNLNAPAVIQAAQRLASWRAYTDPNTDDKAFTAGRVGLSWVGHWVYTDYAKALGKNLLVLPLPNFGDGPKTGQGSFAWGLNPAGEHGKAAAKFLDFLMSDGPVKAITDTNGAPPGTRTVAAQSKLYAPGGPLALWGRQLVQTCGNGPPEQGCVAIPRPVSPGYPVMQQLVADAFWNTYKGSDAKSQFDKAARLIDMDYGDNNDYGITR
jgi:multiple sugar transport system substrate-binding protein